MTALPRFGIFKTEARVVHSACDGQDFDVGVWLPFSYGSSDRSYPVLYVPDGEFLFPAVAGMIPTLVGNGEVPEIIVVGIAYHGINSWEEFGALRDRDLLPQQHIPKPPHTEQKPATRQAQYIDFYRQELFPLIEAEYRALADDRALYGFSSSGFFALDVMLNHPGLFRRVIAASCTWRGADGYFVECARRYAALPARPPVDLYLAAGELEGDGALPGLQQVAEALQAVPEVRLHQRVIAGEGHSSGMFANAFLAGVKAVYH
jgi:hypothetical protein